MTRLSSSLSDLPPTSRTILLNHAKSKRVILNVGGRREEVLWSTLGRLPHSRLGRLKMARTHQEILRLCDDYDLTENMYYFDRHPHSFGSVINFYRSGKLHLVEDICVLAFADDLDYWGIDELYIEPCCQHRYYQRKETVEEDLKKEYDSMKERGVVLTFSQSKYGNLKRQIWEFVEKPQSSKAAKIGAMMFSSLAYFAEKEMPNTNFTSIPAALYWSAISMTTVGYGDIYPQSVPGKVIAACCCICGVLVIALPIPIIVNNFAEFYRNQTRLEKALKRREAMNKARAKGSLLSLVDVTLRDDYLRNARLFEQTLVSRRNSSLNKAKMEEWLNKRRANQVEKGRSSSLFSGSKLKETNKTYFVASALPPRLRVNSFANTDAYNSMVFDKRRTSAAHVNLFHNKGDFTGSSPLLYWNDHRKKDRLKDFGNHKLPFRRSSVLPLDTLKETERPDDLLRPIPSNLSSKSANFLDIRRQSTPGDGDVGNLSGGASSSSTIAAENRPFLIKINCPSTESSMENLNKSNSSFGEVTSTSDDNDAIGYKNLDGI